MDIARKLLTILLPCCIGLAQPLALSALGHDVGSLAFSGSVRLRFEELRNYTVKTFDSNTHDGFLLWRTRLNLDHIIDENTRGFLQIQENGFTRAELSLSDFPTACPYQNRADLRQAYIEGGRSGPKKLQYRIGRQTINYRDNRIFGPGDWGNTGRYSWDGMKVRTDIGVHRVDTFGVKRVVYDPRYFDRDHHPYTVYAVYAASKKRCDWWDFFYVFKDDSDESTGERGTGPSERHTVGSHFKHLLGRNVLHGTIALQRGHQGADGVDSFALHLGLARKWSGRRALRCRLDYSLASGDSDPTDGTCETFDGVFGAIDKYYGRMNLFSWMNLEDLQCSCSSLLSRHCRLTASLHWLRLNEKRDSWYYCTGKAVTRDKTGMAGDDLGREVDLTLTWQATKRFEVQAGHAHFSPGSFPRHQGLDTSADWTFIQTTWKF